MGGRGGFLRPFCPGGKGRVSPSELGHLWSRLRSFPLAFLGLSLDGEEKIEVFWRWGGGSKDEETSSLGLGPLSLLIVGLAL